MKNELQDLIKSWELQEQLLSKEIETGSGSLKEFFIVEKDTLRQCIKELKEVSNVS